MKIIVFTINPIFPDKVTGGASKHLYYIIKHLGRLGHQVEVMCPRTQDLDAPFSFNDKVKVYPELNFSLPFPQPYGISASDLSLITRRISRRLQDADRFYIHDGEWLIPDVYDHVPTAASFRDNIYPESILGTFVGKPDEIISVSDYSGAVIKNTAGLFFPSLRERMHTVINGIDFEFFKLVDPSDLANRLGLDLKEDFILLHPHRPEEGKGLAETIRVVHRLVHRHGLMEVKALIPEWIGSMVSNMDSDFYNQMMRLMQDLDVDKNFIFVPWMPIERMPELYSLGDVTLCLGNIVEAFGNVAYESLACGTPSIVSKVGVHRTLLPDDVIDKVHFGDIDAAVNRILEIKQGKRFNYEQVVEIMKIKMDLQQQVKSYGRIILDCQKRERLRFSSPTFGDQQAFKVPPWCYFKDEFIYHDFRGRFENASQLVSLSGAANLFTKEEAFKAGVSGETWEQWVEKTWIIPSLE